MSSTSLGRLQARWNLVLPPPFVDEHITWITNRVLRARSGNLGSGYLSGCPEDDPAADLYGMDCDPFVEPAEQSDVDRRGWSVAPFGRSIKDRNR
jgi:hypothetical protein